MKINKLYYQFFKFLKILKNKLYPKILIKVKKIKFD